jgi:hypothetical protein
MILANKECSTGNQLLRIRESLQLFDNAVSVWLYFWISFFLFPPQGRVVDEVVPLQDPLLPLIPPANLSPFTALVELPTTKRLEQWPVSRIAGTGLHEVGIRVPRVTRRNQETHEESKSAGKIHSPPPGWTEPSILANETS